LSFLRHLPPQNPHNHHIPQDICVFELLSFAFAFLKMRVLCFKTMLNLMMPTSSAVPPLQADAAKGSGTGEQQKSGQLPFGSSAADIANNWIDRRSQIVDDLSNIHHSLRMISFGRWGTLHLNVSLVLAQRNAGKSQQKKKWEKEYDIV
jgi:hypothetical protein